MMLNYYYADKISDFLQKPLETIIGEISINGRQGHINTELIAWEFQIALLKDALQNKEGHLFFEFSIPRMGKRVDCILIIKNIVFVIEFKVGEKEYLRHHIEQVWDYALDLKHFHEPSHHLQLVPILVATQAKSLSIDTSKNYQDALSYPIRANAVNFFTILNKVLDSYIFEKNIDRDDYINGSYCPTPTIIEAAISLYNNHNVEAITRSDAGATNLKVTTTYIADTITYAKTNQKKVICFVTGVPGAGKTLVGLKVATEHLVKEEGNTSVFLSGNKPLVDILQEALCRDKVVQERIRGNKITKKEARASVKTFIQIIHHYRDEYLRDKYKAPHDHIAIFDEAQRAWTKEQTVKFMKQKKGEPDFQYSEPEFLISCLDRHEDWAVIVCLVGGGQEINTGEAGISEWLSAIKNKYSYWETRISPNLYDSEYAAEGMIKILKKESTIVFNKDLHLAVSMRSFRAEYLSKLIKEVLDIDTQAKNTFQQLHDKYPIVLTRSVERAKQWLKEKARGSERYGIVVSSQAYRLKPLAIDVKAPINHVNWFLDGKDDIRSSYFLEDVATEFQVQGLELDWTCVIWDGDLRYTPDGWKTYSFIGNKWQNIHKDIRKKYLINAYRVLLTRARQGMVIVVPNGNVEDHTRQPLFYDATFTYLADLGITII